MFDVYKLNEKGMTKATKLQSLFEGLVAEIEKLNPVDGRELALARTKLEEACFYAKKAVASHVENHE